MLWRLHRIWSPVLLSGTRVGGTFSHSSQPQLGIGSWGNRAECTPRCPKCCGTVFIGSEFHRLHSGLQPLAEAWLSRGAHVASAWQLGLGGSVSQSTGRSGDPPAPQNASSTIGRQCPGLTVMDGEAMEVDSYSQTGYCIVQFSRFLAIKVTTKPQCCVE